jgi:esterase/lipase superfamily enzyme
VKEHAPEHAAKGAADRRAWVTEVRDLADGMAGNTSISLAGDVLLFVHGYNNDKETVLARQRQLSKDLREQGWRGVVVGFDWPSADSTLNYLEDRHDAARVAVELVRGGVRVLASGQEEGCVTNTHLLGHSTGAYVIMEAFAQAEKDGDLFKSDWRVGQVALIGGDIAADSLEADSEWAGPMFRRIMRLTNYSNPFDKVLGISNAKRLGVAPRVGRVGLTLGRHRKAVDVDCGPWFSGLDPKKSKYFGTFNHSWHIGDPTFALDLAMTLEGGIDRSAIPTRAGVGERLVLVKGARPEFQAAWDSQGLAQPM